MSRSTYEAEELLHQITGTGICQIYLQISQKTLTVWIMAAQTRSEEIDNTRVYELNMKLQPREGQLSLAK